MEGAIYSGTFPDTLFAIQKDGQVKWSYGMQEPVASAPAVDQEGTVYLAGLDNNIHALSPAYPNPFNPTTNIRFTLPQTSKVQLNVYNTLGQKVATLLDRKLAAGAHTTTFNASNLPSGVYIYRLNAGEFSQSRKMLLVK